MMIGGPQLQQFKLKNGGFVPPNMLKNSIVKLAFIKSMIIIFIKTKKKSVIKIELITTVENGCTLILI